jgi:hypothetical protein
MLFEQEGFRSHWGAQERNAGKQGKGGNQNGFSHSQTPF